MIILKEKEIMVDRKILLNFKSLFNKELLKRILSVVFFVPIFIFSLFQSGIVLFLLFIFFFLMILIELINIFNLSNLKIIIFFYSLIAMFCIIIFPFYYFTLENNLIICLYVLVSLWIFDTFSYLGGSIIKGKKIFPKLSKGKTYSGLLSGFLFVIIFNIIISNYIFYETFINLLVLSAIICSLSFAGDACVSLLKRLSNLKDTGTLFIGHGGFLDRMDSFILVFFFFIIFDIHTIINYV